jgi:hypothetical protein
LLLLFMVLPMAAWAQGYEPPNEQEVPKALEWIINFFAQKYVVPFSAALGALLITIVGVLRQVLAGFGTYLKPKMIYVLTLFLAFLTSLGQAASDGRIAGDEWMILLTALASAIAAIFGYRLIFSDNAKARVKPL